MSSTLATPGTIAQQAPLSMGFPRKEYRSAMLFPSLGDLPDPGMKFALASRFFTTNPPGKPYIYIQSGAGLNTFLFLLQISNK